VDSRFWRGRRVFLTGHTGFKGSWLSLLLSRLEARTVGYALAPPTEPALFDLAAVGETLEDHRGDIADLAGLTRALIAADPEIVIHMAAQPLVREGYADPVGTYRTNVIGLVNLLEAVRAAPGVRVVVNVTTDKCYDNRESERGYRETDRLGGADPYASSKACAELATAAYRASFLAERGVAVATARAGNVVGGGDFAADRILPDAIRAFSAGRALEVRNPRAVRPWQHVLDPLSGYLMLAERAYRRGAPFARAWNFGPGAESERTVQSLLARFIEAWGGDARWTADGGRHRPETTLLRLDATRAREELGWRPLLGFDEMATWTAEWHRAHARGADMRAFTRRQIDAYRRLFEASSANAALAQDHEDATKRIA
jgi:CDP-glucose 4,6-dehydratase